MILTDKPDFSQLTTIETQAFDDPWGIDALASVLSSFGAGVLMACDGEQVMGYCIYQVVFETAEILRIATSEHYQRQGVGDKLMLAVIDRCRTEQAQQILLEVRADNAPAIALYHKHGFMQIDIRQGYYHAPQGRVDALILQLDLMS